MTLKECSLKILGFTWGFLVTFKDQRDQDGSQVHRDEERYGGNDPSNWQYARVAILY